MARAGSLVARVEETPFASSAEFVIEFGIGKTAELRIHTSFDALLGAKYAIVLR